MTDLKVSYFPKTAKVSAKETVWSIVVDLKGRILILKRSKKANNPKLLNFPGGGIELGETAIESAYRELQEEAGISSESLTLVHNACFDSLHKRINAFVFITNTKIEVKCNEESSAHYWMKKKELTSNCKKAKAWHLPTFFILNRIEIFNAIHNIVAARKG